MRDTGVTHKRFVGDQKKGIAYIERARVLLGQMKAYLGPGISGSRIWNLGGGVTITTTVAKLLSIITIEVLGEELLEFILWGFYCYPISNTFPRGYTDNSAAPADPPAREPYIFIQPQPHGLGPPEPPLAYKGYQYSGGFGPKKPLPLPQTEKYQKWFPGDLPSEFGQVAVVGGNCDWRGTEQKDPKTNWVHQDIVTWDGPSSRHGNYDFYDRSQFDGLPPDYQNFRGLTHAGMFFRNQDLDPNTEPRYCIREIIKPADAATVQGNLSDYFKLATVWKGNGAETFVETEDRYNHVFYNGVRIKLNEYLVISGACVKVDLDPAGKTQYRLLVVFVQARYPGAGGQDRVIQEEFVTYNFDPGTGEVGARTVLLSKLWSNYGSTEGFDDGDVLYENSSIWIFNASCTKGITDRTQQYTGTPFDTPTNAYRKQVNADVTWTPSGCSVVLSDGDYTTDRTLDIVAGASKVRTYVRRFRDFDGDTLLEGRLEYTFSRSFSHTLGAHITAASGTDSYFARVYMGSDLIWERIDPDESWSYSRTDDGAGHYSGSLAHYLFNDARQVFLDYLDLRSKTVHIASISRDLTSFNGPTLSGGGSNGPCTGSFTIRVENLIFQNGVQVSSRAYDNVISSSTIQGSVLGAESASVSATSHAPFTATITRGDTDSDGAPAVWVDYVNSFSPRCFTFSGVHSWFRTQEGKLSCFSSALDNSKSIPFLDNNGPLQRVPVFQTVLTDGNVPLITGLSGDNQAFVPIKILPYIKSTLKLEV